MSQFKGDIDKIEDAIAGKIDRGRLDLSELQNANFEKIHDFKLREYYEMNDPANNMKVKVEDFGFANYGAIDVTQDPDLALISKHEVYAREHQSMYMVKDLKFADIYAQTFTSHHDYATDVQNSKADLVFDSFILSDFHLISNSLLNTATLQSMINGLSLLPCCFFYAMLINEFKQLDIITILENARVGFYQGSTALIALNLLILISYQLNFLASYNLAFNFGKPGEKSKLK